MKKLLFTLGMTTFLVGCVASQEEAPQLSDWNQGPDLKTEVVVVPPENVITQPDEFREALKKFPDPIQINNTEGGLYMDLLAKKLRKELRSTGVQVREVQGQIDLIIPDKVAFGNNQTKIQTSFQNALLTVTKLLNEYDKTMVQIIGYSDNAGSVLVNKESSLQRAEAIASFLKGHNVHAERIITDGVGPDNPVANNATPAGRQLNRRVEMTLISLQ
ncbi:MAG: OmpA family protein [Alphaproteobacteria bacterium]